MPGKVKVRIIAGRNLPVMDRSSDTSDAFVEVKLGNTTYKTEVCRRTLNPQWNTDWFRFEVDDEELQDEPLQIRIMDYDTYSANDAIGKVYIDLNPLLCKESLPVMSGWFPIYDTMHGIRGEINVAVKVDLFSDFNKYRVSSCGIQFFFSHGIPQGYYLHAILGLVEELVVNDDPEYQWIDKIRTPRSSNEARQTLFSKLSGELQRKIGLKASDLGANAVVGYQQCFDLEGEYGIVVRGIGTAVRITKVFDTVQPSLAMQVEGGIKESTTCDDPMQCNHVGGAGSPTGLFPSKLSQSPAKVGFTCGVRHASDSDLSITPRGNGICPISGRVIHHRTGIHQEGVDMLEYPFVTMKYFPPGVIKRIGGVVAAKSVRKLSHINNPDEPETRDAWWTEIRKEMRSHARAYACNVILGYSESIQISDDVCVLSACGTAALLTSAGEQDDLGPPPNYGIVPLYTCPTTTPVDREKDQSSAKVENGIGNHAKSEGTNTASSCSVFHVPYSETSVPFVANLVRCHLCRKAKVPDFLMMTIEPPPNISVVGKGCLLQARVCRIRKDGRGEHNAKEVSDIIPFLEYEIHKQIMCKVKVKGMNTVFGMKFEISLGEKMIALVASGTAAYVSALPPQTLPKISLARDMGNSKYLDIQRLLEETVAKSREHYGLTQTNQHDGIIENHFKKDEGDSSDEDKPDVDLYSGNKDLCVLEIDDEEDIDAVSLLIDPDVPNGFECSNTSTLPGVTNFSQNLQFFFQIYRTKLPCGAHANKKFAALMNRVMQCLFVKLRNLVPCCLAGLSFHVDIPEQDEVQICALGVAVAMAHQVTPPVENGKPANKQAATTNGETDQELLFSMDDDRSVEAPKPDASSHQLKLLSRRTYPAFPREHHGVDLSSLGYVPGGRIERYLGNLDFFFIRESTSVREGGGLNGFIHSFISEVLAILRAHVAALGGNAVVALHITQCVLLDNPHKNQAQCLINVGGDAVQVQYLWDSTDSTNGRLPALSTLRETD